MDQISQLPDPILQHILFFLPAKDAAQTSVLSRTWLKVWNLLPILTFDFDENLFIQKHLSAEIEEQELADERDAFLNHINSSLTNLRIQKAIIQKFRLSLNFSDTKNASCIDEWIGLATNNCINELDIHIMRQDDILDWYILPVTTFTAKSLVVLRLGGCKLEWPLFVDHIKLTKLRELSLTDVYLDERIMLEIISTCPAVEDLSLVECRGVKDILISNLPNLLKLTLHQEDEIAYESILIQAVKLQSLNYRGCNDELKFDVAAFKFLKELSIMYERITDQMVENLVSELPLLEKLELNFCFKLTRLKFSSCVLRQLTFRSYKSLIEVEIDTPMLLRFEYGAPKLPAIFSMTTSSLQESYLRLMPNEHLGTSWFQRLREYLSGFKQLDLELVLSINSTTNTFTVEELNETSLCSPYVVKHLMVKDVAPPLNFESLLDGLFWTCHPETLSVESMWGRSDEFMQFLRDKLMEKEGVQPVCCNSRSVKCWRPYLKGIEVESSTTNLYGDPYSPCQVSTICFKLRW